MEQGSKRLSVQVCPPVPLPELMDGSAGGRAGFLSYLGMCVGSDLRPELYRGVPISHYVAICFGNISIVGFLFVFFFFFFYLRITHI